MPQATTTERETNWFNSAGRLIREATKPLNTRTTKKYEKAAATASNDWSELCIAVARGEGEPTEKVIVAVAASIRVDSEKAITTFRQDVKTAKAGLTAMRERAAVSERYKQACGGVSEKEALQKLTEERDTLQRRLKEIVKEGTLIAARGRRVMHGKVDIDRAASNSRLFPSGQRDIEAALKTKTQEE